MARNTSRTTNNPHDQSFWQSASQRHLRRTPSELETATTNQSKDPAPPGPWAHLPAPVLDGRTWRPGPDAPGALGRPSRRDTTAFLQLKYRERCPSETETISPMHLSYPIFSLYFPSVSKPLHQHHDGHDRLPPDHPAGCLHPRRLPAPRHGLRRRPRLHGPRISNRAGGPRPGPDRQPRPQRDHLLCVPSTLPFPISLPHMHTNFQQTSPRSRQASSSPQPPPPSSSAPTASPTPPCSPVSWTSFSFPARTR